MIVEYNTPGPLFSLSYLNLVLLIDLYQLYYHWLSYNLCREHNYGESVASVNEGRSYYYTTEWRDKLIDSRRFYIQSGHHNPERFPIESETQIASAVFIGRYELGQEIKEKFNKYVELTSDTRPEDPSIKLHLGLYYHTNDIFNPEIGDIRLLFSFAGMEGEVVSYIEVCFFF